MRKQFSPHAQNERVNETLEIVDFGEQSAILIPKEYANKIDPYASGRVQITKIINIEQQRALKDAVKKGLA